MAGDESQTNEETKETDEEFGLIWLSWWWVWWWVVWLRVVVSYKRLQARYLDIPEHWVQEWVKIGHAPEIEFHKLLNICLPWVWKSYPYHCLRTINFITVCASIDLSCPLNHFFSRRSVTLWNWAAGSLFWDGHAVTQSQWKNETGCRHRSAACGCDLYRLLLCLLISAWTTGNQRQNLRRCAEAQRCHMWKRNLKKSIRKMTAQQQTQQRPFLKLDPPKNSLQPSLYL